ncbi:MAG: bifunctional UDP-3-O-[3-hydroxymyristoyl] N-acetylglucosamine deacetylase/3-hydroxyacyl-ACP dehydratase [Bacteroidia bacterium]|nr:bifunctional UDP-3-O-[3-hydroxymyristoyl] N-acetylglucosamine deacetylase/3-hydroxyacyl-ACP dehydratase [Bacteroidia bacterium]
MYEKQHTISGEVQLSGKGLHTGAPVTLTICPADENHGIVFCRTDIAENPSVRADIENVVDLSRGTTIAHGEAKVHTVEHILAALAGLQIDNALIQLDGPEPPALDGSSRLFVDAIRQKTTIIEQKANREFYVIDQPVQYTEEDRGVDLVALPMDDLRITVMVDYDSKVLGPQHATLIHIEDFVAEISNCRTFCFLHELEALLNAGLIKGGDLNNAIVIVDKEVPQEQLDHLSKLFNRSVEVASQGILNNIELRFSNEPARHKLLDLVGDLTLLGAPLKAQIIATRPGHAANVAFAKKIRSLIKQKKITRKFQQNHVEGFVFDIQAIQRILPHRYPFLLIDRILNFDEKTIEGIKNVTINEPFFEGHFPGNPIMPGVLQMEAMAQVGGILLLNIIESPQDVWVYLQGIEKARFKRPIVPGDQVLFRIELLALRMGICKMQGKAFVDGKVVCEAELTAGIIRKTP